MENKIEKLCHLVNEKYGLKRNEIGSIEYHRDMCENSIVQIKNKYRGTIQLIYGDDKTLIAFLQKILENKIKISKEEL